MPLKKYLLILVAAVLAIASCKKNSAPVTVVTADVYVTGYVTDNNGNEVGTIWKNGVAASLPGSIPFTFPGNITLSQTDEYTVGSTRGANGHGVATFWKNGVPTILSDTSDGDSYATSIAIKGTDVFISGNTHFSNGSSTAQYWVNTPASRVVDSTNFYEILGIVANTTDLYMVGWSLKHLPSGTSDYGIVYTKNGVVTKLPFNTFPRGVKLVGNDLYITGTIYNGPGSQGAAAYWKNGVVTLLTDSTHYSAVINIAVSGTDVYAVGYTGSSQPFNGYIPSAVCWKNGTPVTLAGSTGSDGATNVTISGTDVYITGSINGNPGYWKNGVPVVLGTKGEAQGIIVVPR